MFELEKASKMYNGKVSQCVMSSKKNSQSIRPLKNQPGVERCDLSWTLKQFPRLSNASLLVEEKSSVQPAFDRFPCQDSICIHLPCETCCSRQASFSQELAG